VRSPFDAPFASLTAARDTPHNAVVRLIKRSQAKGSLEEGECYERSYGEHVLGNVDLVQLEHTDVHLALPEPAHHVTTRQLKLQFEARLAARRRGRR
jgi:hypothetical protein